MVRFNTIFKACSKYNMLLLQEMEEQRQGQHEFWNFFQSYYIYSYDNVYFLLKYGKKWIGDIFMRSLRW